ncbi:hypothetical protein NA57DRAFT_80375 [Rhizodiscina lignyota]|uniref:Uncharacterized protein n=1 Tax=Rhizodiscina lignyota TaxID=1504668 RepID=A0A9P4M2E9_9PEZI|nr:hypothetical protein NA57DRAFT_80375 [Rhizodiscina lignyota]
MADALCGPSNPLQNFQKHSNVDRTLQQDRLISRHSPSQGFRSSPGPAAGSLDPEFEAFQAGIPTGPAPHEFHQFPHQPLPLHAAEPLSQPPGWAADFQRLHISPQSHSPAPVLSPQAQAHRQSPASWHQDFLRQQHTPPTSATPPQMQQHAPMRSAFSSMPMYGMHNPSTSFYEPSFDERPAMTVAEGKQREQVQAEVQWDDAAFERAFDAVHQETMSTEDDFADAFSADLQEIGQRLDAQNLDTKESLEADIQRFKDQVHDDPLADQHDILDAIEAEALARQRFEDDRLLEEEKQDMRPPDADEDELSRTAGQLLESVSHETSKKFQESNFLALMRRLRDREVRVEGDKMVEVRDPFLTSSANFIPSATSTPVSTISTASSVPMSVTSSRTSLSVEEAVREEMASRPMWIDWVDAEGRRHIHPAPAADEQCRLYQTDSLSMMNEPLLHDRIDPILQDSDDGRTIYTSSMPPEFLQELPKYPLKDESMMSGAISRSNSSSGFADDIDIAISASVRSQMARYEPPQRNTTINDTSRLNLYRLPIESFPKRDDHPVALEKSVEDEEWAS